MNQYIELMIVETKQTDGMDRTISQFFFLRIRNKSS